MEEQSDSGKTEIFAADVRDEALINRLTQVWRKSVKATHLFLSDEEVEQIAVYVPEALKRSRIAGRGGPGWLSGGIHGNRRQ